MRVSRLTVVVALVAAGILAVPSTASAGPSKVERATATFDFTDNLRPIGFSSRTVPLDNLRPRQGSFNSDLAFWGDTAVQGTYAGFRLIDVDDPDKPKEIIDWEDCASPTNTRRQPGRRDRLGRPAGQAQAVARHPLVELADSRAEVELQTARRRMPRSRRATRARLTQPAAFCGDWPMFRVPRARRPIRSRPPAVDRGQEGVHIIDVSDPEEPEVVAFVDLPCGSHTETLVPDLATTAC